MDGAGVLLLKFPLMPLSKAISPISSPPYIPPLHSTTDIFYSLFFVGNFIRKMRHFWCRRFALFLNLAILFALSFFFLLLNFNKQFTVKFDQLDKRKEGLSSFEYKLNDNRGRELSISELILPKGSASLQERITLNPIPESQSILLMWDLDFSDLNLRGCPEWNCKITRNHSLFGQARAIFFGSSNYAIERRPNQYFVHYSQESPVNMPSGIVDHFFNMSFGFRMGGNWAASPYGFAAKLAPESRPGPKYLDELLDGIVGKKNKPIAWFVSHCSTQSGREWIAKEMQKHIQMDIYGGCGPMECHRGSNCKEMLNTDYFFYFAAENSICRDYLTEKIWDQGLDTFSVPIVLRRSIAEHLLPPGSFIAIDDFDSILKLTEHLHKLMQNPLEYMQYFEWRLEYVAIKLNGDTDPRAEKLFGICQVCRLTQMKPMPSIKLPAPMKKWWDESCEKQGKLVDQFKNIKRKTN